MSAATDEPSTPGPENAVGMEVFSREGEPIGRVTGYVSEALEDEVAIEEGVTDAVRLDGTVIGKRHIRIDTRGYMLQIILAVPEDLVTIDARGRRAHLDMSLEELRALARQESNAHQQFPIAQDVGKGTP